MLELHCIAFTLVKYVRLFSSRGLVYSRYKNAKPRALHKNKEQKPEPTCIQCNHLLLWFVIKGKL